MLWFFPFSFPFLSQYNNSYEPDRWVDADTDISPSKFDLEVELSPWANYTFQVFARNKLGASKPSPISRVCSTKADTPDKNPDGVKGSGKLGSRNWRREPI